MATTLQDVVLLLGLPITGTPVFPSDALAHWRDDLLSRFQGVLPADYAPPYYGFQER